jgi:hypothetical protein
VFFFSDFDMLPLYTIGIEGLYCIIYPEFVNRKILLLPDVGLILVFTVNIWEQTYIFIDDSGFMRSIGDR